MAYFANNPIIATVTCGSFPEGATNKRIVLTVTINGNKHPFYHSAESGDNNINIDVSSAYRAELRRRGYPDLANPSSAQVTGTCTVVGQCVVDGLVTEIGDGFSVSGGNVSARHGGYKDIDRRNGTPQAPEILSTKPTSTAEVVNVGDHVALGSDMITAVGGVQTFKGRTIYGEMNNFRHTMYFLNQYGEIETAAVVTMEALSVQADKETVSQVRGPQSASYAQERIYKTGGYNQWKMSTGYLEREWLSWFAHDFLMSKFHWIQTKNGIIPCTVDAGDVDIYDKASDEIKAINFTVKSGLSGDVEL